MPASFSPRRSRALYSSFVRRFLALPVVLVAAAGAAGAQPAPARGELPEEGRHGRPLPGRHEGVGGRVPVPRRLHGRQADPDDGRRRGARRLRRRRLARPRPRPAGEERQSYRKNGRTQPLEDCTRLFRNRGGGTFEDVTERSGLRACGWGISAMWADLDGDGFPDLVIGNAGEPNTLGRTMATGRSRMWRARASRGAGSRSASRRSTPTGTASGRLRRQLPRHRPGPRVEATPASLHDARPVQGAGQLSFRGLGNSFEDRTEESGRATRARRRSAPWRSTTTATGWTDLYVSNDQWRNTLFHNEGNGTFRDVSDETGTGYPQDGPTAFGRRTRSGMGLVAQDLDGDGRPDLFVTNFANEPNTLYRNVEGTVFEQSERAGLRRRPTTRDPAVEVGSRGDRLRRRRQRRPRGLERADPLAPLDRRLASGSTRSPRTSGSGRRATPSASSSSTTRARPGPSGSATCRQSRATSAGSSSSGAGSRRATWTATAGSTSSSTRSTGRRSFSGTGARRALARDPPGRRGGPEDDPRDARDGRRTAKEFYVVPSYASGSWMPLHFGLGNAASARVTVRWPGGETRRSWATSRRAPTGS